jgi:hypothetical protein
MMKVEIIVDGESLGLNDFVQRVAFGVSSGLVNSLHEVPEWSTVEIKLTK